MKTDMPAKDTNVHIIVHCAHAINALTNSDHNSGGVTRRCHLLVTHRTTR